MSEEILSTIKTELAFFENANSQITPDRQLDTLPIDSLTEIVLLVSLEDRYDIEISLVERKSLETIGDLVILVEQKMVSRPIAA